MPVHGHLVGVCRQSVAGTSRAVCPTMQTVHVSEGGVEQRRCTDSAKKVAKEGKKAGKPCQKAEKAPFCVLGNESCDPCKSSEERSPRKAQAKRGGSSRVVLTVGGG